MRERQGERETGKEKESENECKKIKQDEKDRVREIIFVLSKFKVELIASDQPIRSIKMSLKPFSNTV